MVRVKQERPSAVIGLNTTVCDDSSTRELISPDKEKRQRKSTSAMLELNNTQENQDLNFSMNDDCPEKGDNGSLKKMQRKCTMSKKENIDTNSPISTDKKKSLLTNSCDVKLEVISVNTLEKRKRSVVSYSQSTDSSNVKADVSLNTQNTVTEAKSTPKASTKVKKNAKEVENEKSDLSDSSDSELEIEDEAEILESLDLEFKKLHSNPIVKLKKNICHVCEMSGAQIECKGTCKKLFHVDCIGFVTENEIIDYKCSECKTGLHPCITCNKVSSDTSSDSKKCNSAKCGKYFHDECASKENRELFREHGMASEKVSKYNCPSHACMTCWLDAEADLVHEKEPFKGHFVNCVRCPNTYHVGDFCLPAGSLNLDDSNIICADHFKPNAKLPIHNRVNVAWCFLCCKTGSLTNCTTCPSAYHLDCIKEAKNSQKLNEKNIEQSMKEDLESVIDNAVLPESSLPSSDPDTIDNNESADNFRCVECVNGKRPLYGDIVWSKVGIYRWWPAQICHPRNLPEKLKDKPYQVGEFPVRFFGTHDYYWVSLRRCFYFAVGDEFQKSANKLGKSLGAAYTEGVIDAMVGFREIRRLKSLKYAHSKSSSQPSVKQAFSFIKQNRPIGNVKILRPPLSELPVCDCGHTSEDPCGSEDCVNIALRYECHPAICLAGPRCQNQRFVKRQYPKQKTIETEDGRGCGLMAMVDIKKGEFVNEYVGELIDDEECRRRLDWAHKNNINDFYLMTIEKDRVIDAGPKGNLARFMNHSCEPNCETQRWVVNGDIRIGLFAVKDITALSELTFNYNFNCVDNKHKAICRCGADSCSGFLGAPPKTSVKSTGESKSSKTNPTTSNQTNNNSKKRKQNARQSLDTSVDLPFAKKQKGRSKSTVSPMTLDIVKSETVLKLPVKNRKSSVK